MAGRFPKTHPLWAKYEVSKDRKTLCSFEGKIESFSEEYSGGVITLTITLCGGEGQMKENGE